MGADRSSEEGGIMKAKCKYCIYFGYLAEKIEEVDADGWCIKFSEFMKSTDESCAYFQPRLKKGGYE
jgi:hypothetical protein